MSNPWFAALPDEVRADVLARGRPLAFVSGQRLFMRGEIPHGVLAVLEGIVRLSGVSRDGRETILDFYGPGHWIGEVSLFAEGRRIHDADAHTAAVVLHVAAADVEALLAAHPHFSRAFLKLEAQRLTLLLQALEIYSTRTLDERLAHRLLLLAASHGDMGERGVVLDIKLSQETLARLIGSTRQRVGQILEQWIGEGIVEARYGRVVLLDRKRLERLAE